MKRTWVFDKDGKAHEITRRPTLENAAPYVQPDFEEHGGKRKWREYLKRTGNIEMGHSDMKAMEANYRKRQQAFKESLNSKEAKHVRMVDAPQGEVVERERTRLDKEVMNRLHNRPAPDLPMLVKMTLEEARRRR